MLARLDDDILAGKLTDPSEIAKRTEEVFHAYFELGRPHINGSLEMMSDPRGLEYLNKCVDLFERAPVGTALDRFREVCKHLSCIYGLRGEQVRFCLWLHTWQELDPGGGATLTSVPAVSAATYRFDPNTLTESERRRLTRCRKFSYWPNGELLNKVRRELHADDDLAHDELFVHLPVAKVASIAAEYVPLEPRSAPQPRSESSSSPSAT
jgi:hypothetical protein